MGDIIVTGDLYGDEAVKAFRKPAVQETPPDLPVAPELSPEPSAGMSPWVKVAAVLALTAYLGTVGLNLASYLGVFDKQPPPAVETPEFSDRDTYPGVVIERPSENQSDP